MSKIRQVETSFLSRKRGHSTRFVILIMNIRQVLGKTSDSITADQSIYTDVYPLFSPAKGTAESKDVLHIFLRIPLPLLTITGFSSSMLGKTLRFPGTPAKTSYFLVNSSSFCFGDMRAHIRDSSLGNLCSVHMLRNRLNPKMIEVVDKDVRLGVGDCDLGDFDSLITSKVVSLLALSHLKIFSRVSFQPKNSIFLS